MGFDVILVESFDGLFAKDWILLGRWLICRGSGKSTRQWLGSGDQGSGEGRGVGDNFVYGISGDRGSCQRNSSDGIRNVCDGMSSDVWTSEGVGFGWGGALMAGRLPRRTGALTSDVVPRFWILLMKLGRASSFKLRFNGSGKEGFCSKEIPTWPMAKVIWSCTACGKSWIWSITNKRAISTWDLAWLASKKKPALLVLFALA